MSKKNYNPLQFEIDDESTIYEEKKTSNPNTNHISEDLPTVSLGNNITYTDTITPSTNTNNNDLLTNNLLQLLLNNEKYLLNNSIGSKTTIAGPCACGYKHYWHNNTVKDFILQYPVQNIGMILFGVNIDDDISKVADTLINENNLPASLKAEIYHYITTAIYLNCAVSGYKYTSTNTNTEKYIVTEEDRRKVKTDIEQEEFNRRLRLMSQHGKEKRSKKLSDVVKASNAAKIKEETKRIHDERRKKKFDQNPTVTDTIPNSSLIETNTMLIEKTANIVNNSSSNITNTNSTSIFSVENDNEQLKAAIELFQSSNYAQLTNILNNYNSKDSIVDETNNNNGNDQPAHSNPPNELNPTYDPINIEKLENHSCYGYLDENVSTQTYITSEGRLQRQKVRFWKPCILEENCSRCSKEMKNPVIINDDSSPQSSISQSFHTQISSTQSSISQSFHTQTSNKERTAGIHTLNTDNNQNDPRSVLAQLLTTLEDRNNQENDNRNLSSSYLNPSTEACNSISSPPHARHEIKTTSDTSSILPIDANLPSTRIKIKLHDGTEIQKIFNLSHTIRDIKDVISTLYPEKTIDKKYVLTTLRPSKELQKEEQTIEQAGLSNSVIVQKILL